MPLAVGIDPVASEAWANTFYDTVAKARLGKIEPLARHYGCTKPLSEILNSTGILLGLLIHVATDFVPAFQVVLSGYGPISLGAGRPKRDPTFIPQLIRLIDLILATGMATTDEGALELYVETHHPELAGPQNSSRRAKRVKTLKNLLARGAGGSKPKAGWRAPLGKSRKLFPNLRDRCANCLDGKIP